MPEKVDVLAALDIAIRDALGLTAPTRLTDVQTRQIRKDLKRARAALRLLRSALPDAVYAAENCWTTPQIPEAGNQTRQQVLQAQAQSLRSSHCSAIATPSGRAGSCALSRS